MSISDVILFIYKFCQMYSVGQKYLKMDEFHYPLIFGDI
jgi:hypothetical protein